MSSTIRIKRGTTEPTTSDLITGELAINTVDGNLYSKLDDGTVSNVIAKTRKLTATVRNESGSTISEFNAVYINGASGNKATVALARADTETTSSRTFAVTSASISNNNNGEVVVSGMLEKVDTSAFTAGDVLWLSTTTAGGFTTTKPTAPNHAVFIGVVTRSHATQGSVEIKIQNGYELGELHNVSVASPSNGDVLTYNSSTGLWESAAPTGGGGGGGISDAPSDGSQYARQNGSWSVVSAGGISDAPSDGKSYSRKDSTWVTGRINEYDNFVTYQVGDQVIYNNAIYKLTNYIGGAGYDPVAYSGNWTGISGPSGANGSNGTNGTNGASVVYQGTWNYSTSYSVNDWVVYSGLPYICIYSNTGNTPDVSTSYWLPLYINGTNGTNGTNGSNGTNGTNGVMNPLDILTITANSYGAYVSSGAWSVNYSFLHNSGMTTGWMANKYPTVYFNLYVNGTLDSTISGSYSYYYASGTPVTTTFNTGDHIEVKLSDGAGGEATFNYAEFYF